MNKEYIIKNNCGEPRRRSAAQKILWQYRIILSADTASEVRQMLSQKRR